MNRYRGDCPVGFTCPFIDRVIDILKENIKGDDLKESLELMEKIRGMNDTLRVWGIKMEEERNENQNIIDDLENKLELEKKKYSKLRKEYNNTRV